jgi:DNA-binding NtrC family response regulator
MLVHFFVDRFAARVGKRIERIDEDTMQLLRAYAWPGNVRELENVLERAVILASGPTLEIDPDLLPAPAQTAPSADGASLEAVERNHILAVLHQVRWVIDGPAGAARVLGLHPNTLRSRMKKLRIARPSSP